MNSAPASTRATPRVLSVIAPMTQLNTPYPSTAYLTGFLRSQGFPAEQADLALELVLALFSQQGLQALVVAYCLLPCVLKLAAAAALYTWIIRYPRGLAPLTQDTRS